MLGLICFFFSCLAFLFLPPCLLPSLSLHLSLFVFPYLLWELSSSAGTTHIQVHLVIKRQ